MLRTADYLNSGTSEVELASKIYEEAFEATEKMAHFFFNCTLVVYLNVFATPLILMLIPITLVVQQWRRHPTTVLLDKRQVAERQYVSAMSDIIEVLSADTVCASAASATGSPHLQGGRSSSRPGSSFAHRHAPLLV